MAKIKRMMMKYAVILWWVLFVWLTLAVCGVFAAERLVVLHSSEHHGVALALGSSGDALVGGFSRRATIVEEVRREGAPVLVVDSGDILIGTAMSSWFRGVPDIQAMNRIRYDGMVAGNHDFDFGLDHLQTLTDLADFPILCTNLQAKEFQLPCRRSFVTRLGAVSVGVLGIVGKSNFPETFNREVVQHLTLLDSIPSITFEAGRLRTNFHVDLIVVLTHQDTDEDLMILNSVEDVDVIIGGHTLGFDGLYSPGMNEPVEMVKNPSRVYVKTHRQGRTIGRLDLTIEDGVLVQALARNIPVMASVPEEPNVHHLLEGYRQQFAREATRVLGQSSGRLHGDRPLIRTQETNFGNLLADRIRSTVGADVALINAGQIRGSIEPGPVTLGDVLSVLPFDSSLVTLQVTGSVLRQVLENSVSQWPNHAGRFLQVSGIRVAYDTKAAVGTRVHTLHVGGHLVDPSKYYSVVTDVFVADGGDGYDMLVETTHRIDHQMPLRDIFLAALAEGPLQAETDQRIAFVPLASSP